MKKIISIILAAVTALCLFIPALAAENSRFGVTVVSENDTKAVVSIDFNGGTAFNCLDFEVELSNRVSVTDCSNGAGLRNFKIYVGDLGTQDATLSNFNKDSNPIKFTFATTVGFKAVNGKDLLVITLKKDTADKLTSKDVKLTVTNCGISGAQATSAVIIGTTVTQIGEKSNTPVTVPGQAGTTVAKTSSAAKTDATTAATTVDSSKTTVQTEITDEHSGQTPDANAETEKKQPDRNKIIIVAALAISMIAVIAAGVIFIAKKYKKEDKE